MLLFAQSFDLAVEHALPLLWRLGTLLDLFSVLWLDTLVTDVQINAVDI